MIKQKFYQNLFFLLIITLLGFLCFKTLVYGLSSAHEANYPIYGTEVMQQETEGIKTKTNQLEYIPETLKTKTITEAEHIKDGRLVKSTYYAIKDLFLRIDYYNDILTATNKHYLTLNTAQAFVNQHDPNSESYIEGDKIFPSDSLTEANSILDSMETTVEGQDGPVQDTINKINQGLNELNACDLTKTDPKNLKNIREITRQQNTDIVQVASNNLVTAKNSLKQDLSSLIELAENNLINP